MKTKDAAHLRKLAALFLLTAAPSLAQDQEIQKQLIQRQQQSDSFTLQLRQSQELFEVPPARRQEAESRQLAERQRLDNVNERQLRDVKPDTPQELRPQERERADDDRRPLIIPAGGIIRSAESFR